MYQPVALFIGLRYMRGEPRDRFRAVCFLAFHHRHYAGGDGVGHCAVGDERIRKDLENNISGLMPQALITSPQGSVNPQQLPASEVRSCGASRALRR